MGWYRTTARPVGKIHTEGLEHEGVAGRMVLLVSSSQDE